jgi:hypothetical protein
MKTSHVVALAVLVAVSAALGTFALTRTTELGVQARTASSKSIDATVAARAHQLNALETSLRKALAKKPPALPPLPKAKTHSQQTSAPVYSAPVYSRARTVTVTRVASPAPRPAPTVQRVEQDHEPASGGESDD